MPSQTFTSNGTFTPSVSGVHTVEGYGGGQGTNNSLGLAAGGAAGADYAKGTVSLTLGVDTLTIVVGAAGAPGSITGGDSTAAKGLTNVILAKGGGSGSTSSGGIGGTVNTGAAGGSAGVGATAGGGGGGAGGSTGNGTAGGASSGTTPGTGGAGGGGNAGAGGNGGVHLGTASNGSNYGGGAGGPGSSGNGASGGAGEVIVSWVAAATVNPGLLLLHMTN